jgi:hypothetical protein
LLGRSKVIPESTLKIGSVRLIEVSPTLPEFGYDSAYWVRLAATRGITYHPGVTYGKDTCGCSTILCPSTMLPSGWAK